MRRRLMLRNEIVSGNRIYIFRDGHYGDWLNGTEMTSIQCGGTTYYSYTISNDNNEIYIVMNSSRLIFRAFYVPLSAINQPIKKLGIAMSGHCESPWPKVSFGVAETMINIQDGNTFQGTQAFTTYQETQLTADFNVDTEMLIDENVSPANFAYIVLDAYGGQSYARINNFWLEV